MLTLNQATSMTKGLAKWVAIIASISIAIFLIFKIGTIVKDIVSPTPPPPPTVAFGVLPEIKFPISIDTKKYSFTLDTLSGDFPQFPDRAKVFKTIPESADLLALQKAIERARSIDFRSSPIRIVNNEYQWSDPDSANARKLTLDIFSYKFSVSSSYMNDPNVISANNLPDPEKAKSDGRSFLNSMSVLSDDIDMDNIVTTNLSISNGKLIPASSIANTQIIKVDFFQKAIDELPIYYPGYPESTMMILIAGGKNKHQIVQANFFHQSVSENSATYPIKTASEAFEDLKNGNAYIISGENEDILVRDISVGYYMSDEKQEYMLPIVVLKGNNNFIAYVSAVKNEWVNTPDSQN